MQLSSVLMSSSSWSSQAMLNRQAMPASANDPSVQGSETTLNPVQETDSVSLHSNAATRAHSPAQDASAYQPPEVFAEIWKDGMKIGVVFTDGQAALPSMFGGISASSGTMLPYLRAKEISQQVGGEVRYVNIPALKVAQTRAQLRAAYGA